MTVSFLHSGTPAMASYRYRAALPAQACGASLNDPTADVLVFAKGCEDDVETLRQATRERRTTIVDVCDIHWHNPRTPWWTILIREAAWLTANTDFTKQLIWEDFGRVALVRDDPAEYSEQPPHCAGTRLLWFGHPSNGASLMRLLSLTEHYPLTIVTDMTKWAGHEQARCLQWTPEVLQAELAQADIVLLPETAPHKSANRAVEAIRVGCAVVAEPHPSLTHFPNLWRGNLRKGIQWVQDHPNEANQRTAELQRYVQGRFSLERVGSAWKTLVQGCTSISAQGVNAGLDGSMLMASGASR